MCCTTCLVRLYCDYELAYSEIVLFGTVLFCKLYIVMAGGCHVTTSWVDDVIP